MARKTATTIGNKLFLEPFFAFFYLSVIRSIVQAFDDA
tara:strand:+ start:377 stop:490 length:114 start_codon:yes stop_codon:yes gene_type:complete